MKTKTVITILILMFNSIWASLQIHPLLKKAIKLSEKAFIKNDVNLYNQSAALCERIISAEPENSLAKYFLAYNEYRILQFPGISENRFRSIYESATKMLADIEHDKELLPEVKTLTAALTMMKLANNPAEAPALSSRIYTLLGEAAAIDSSNPRIYLIKGIMLFHTPKMFGGSLQKALVNFDKSISIFEHSAKQTVNWGYLEALAWKGQALAKLGKTGDAKSIYEKALNAEPEFGWVKNALLPGLLKENQEQKKRTAKLTVIITGLNNDKGNVRVALCNSKENYTGEKPYRAEIAKIKNGTASCTFENIPYGTYAVKFYHDENLNEELDKNLFGMPTEEYGFSNNATGNFGPASFEDAKFEINEPEKTITITAQ